ncbi:MAG: carboxypeptidase-like regulatory domain-containing protein [Ignavibacteriota bacterium]
MTRIVILAALSASILDAAGRGVCGEVEDSRGRILAGAAVVIQSESTGARWSTAAGPDGRYSVAPLDPGRYKVTVRMPGFRTVSRVGAVLDSGEEVRIDFAMEVLAIHETITVTSDPDAMNPASGSSLVMSRGSAGATLPANGGDYRVLFDLMPGVVITAASTSDAGQFTSNGQRPNSNTFRVDGISANTGVGSSALPGAFPGASLPAMTAIGTTENLVSNETAQSVELRTSDFSPEFGNREGAEALVNTRSGSNVFHAEFFSHVRDSGWNARDWFSNSRGLNVPRPLYGRLGFALGGPIFHKGTFYFFSAEATTLSDSGVQLTSVPSLITRQNAPEKLKPILDYYPYPTGPDLGGGEAEGLLLTNDAGDLLSTNLRIDQELGRRGSLFFRAAESPSRTLLNRYNWESGTLGLTLTGQHGIHDLRFNFSRADLLSSWNSGGPGFGDAVFTAARMLPGYVVTPDGVVEYQPFSDNLTTILPSVSYKQTILGLSVPGLGQFVSVNFGSARQDQWEGRETFSRTVGRYEFRAGADYVRLAPSRTTGTYAVLGVASSLQGLIDGQPLAVTVSSPAENGGLIHQASLFAQDAFHLSDSLSLLFGLGWTITPPSANGSQVPTVSGLWTGTEWQDLYPGSIYAGGPWPMRWRQLAPRFGMAYRLPFGGVVLRAGAGIFYDATLGAAVNPINGAPFNSWQLASGGSGVDTATGPSDGTSSGLDQNSPDVQHFLTQPYPPLRLPASYQWRFMAEKAVGAAGTAEIAYTGSVGRNLLGHEAYIVPATGVVERMGALTEGSSSYQSLQGHYSGMLLRNLYGTISYTWAHSIDDGSQDSSVFLIHPGYHLDEARGSSSFDVRQAATAALQYHLPRLAHSSPLPPWLGGWNLSGAFRLRTGFPIDVQNADQPLGQGFDNVGRPNRVPGVPIWIADPLVPGHRRLNPAAFSVPANGLTGTLGRNTISGNAMSQIDLSLRREIPIFRRLSAEIGINVFNVLNHPAFADPVPFLASPWFGQSTSMQNMMLGSGSPNTGLPPLFQTGGPRSAEFSFRISF